MMNGLGFRCCYTAAKDVDGTSPCGRHATRREKGESKCLGHRVIEWLVRAYGGGSPDRARTIYGRAFAVLTFVEIVSCVQSVLKMFAGDRSEYTTIQAGVNIGLTGLFASIALGFALENPFGGRLWLIFSPVSSVALLLWGRLYLSGGNPTSTSRLVDLLYASVYSVLALVILGGWSIFLLEYAGRYRLATFLGILCEVLGAAVVLTGVGLAVASHGAENGFIVMTVVLIVLAVMVRGVTRLKKLAEAFRV